MALITCKECSSKISDTAKACPQCGAKVPPKTSFVTKAVLAVIGLGVLLAIINKPDKVEMPAKTPAQIAEDSRKEAEFQSVVLKLKALKSSAKDPSSFELVNAILMANGTLCAEYRAKNSFNATVTETKAITAKGTEGNWNKECADKSGKSFKHAKHAL